VGGPVNPETAVDALRGDLKDSGLTRQGARRMFDMRKRAIVQLAAIAVALSLLPLMNGCSEEATTSPGLPSIQDTSPPAPPVGLDVSSREAGFILKWSPNVEPDLVGYNVYVYSPDPYRSESYVKLNKEVLSTTEFRRGKLNQTDHMIFRLTAVDQSGNESGFSSLVVASASGVQLKEQ
jgi:hypothetical protein